MTKGFRGESCSYAIKQCFANGNQPLSYSQIIPLVKRQGDWKDITIWRYLMATVVNLIPARLEYPHTEKFLFLRPDGRYELYNKSIHPKPIE